MSVTLQHALLKALPQWFSKDLTLSSNIDMAMPEAAPAPARPIKCPDPILLANSDAPTWTKEGYEKLMSINTVKAKKIYPQTRPIVNIWQRLESPWQNINRPNA